MRILLRATNWVGDAVMSLPAVNAVRARFPEAEITVLARAWVAELYAREPAIDRVMVYPAGSGLRGWKAKLSLIRKLRAQRFDCAILFQNAFEAALAAAAAGIPRRIGYSRDGRGWLLSDAVALPRPGEMPRHERFYYLELLRRTGILEALPQAAEIRLARAEEARERGAARFRELGLAAPVIGVSPGAAFGSAKRWLPERFAGAAVRLAGRDGSVAVFGSAAERALAASVAGSVRAAGCAVHDFSGSTTLSEFIDLAAGASALLTNDSGAMHIASALGVPTTAIFGATDDAATGPAGPCARVVRRQVECSPCLLRECPIDHRCMERVTVDDVVDAVSELWIQGTRSSG